MGKFDTHGGHFAPNGYLKVEEGGSHEENPNGGVQLGVDGQGVPNMLEENEPVYDDFVYSDNVVADKEMLKKYKLHEKYAGKKYSEIADLYVDEAENRPNDPISNNGLNTMLVRLANAQEEQKQLSEQKEIEDELANLSPEELAELEAMLGQTEGEQTQQPVAPEQALMEQSAPGVMPYAFGGPVNKFILGGDYDGYDPGSMTPEEYARITGLSLSDLGAVNSMTPEEYIRIHSGLSSEQPSISAPPVEPVKPVDNKKKVLSTWQRYTAPVMSGLLGLYDVFQPADEYNIPHYSPILPYGRLNLVDPTYNPVDENLVVNDILAQSAGTARSIRNAGLGPAVGATLLSADFNAGRNICAARLQAKEANDQQRNAVIAGINQNRSALGQFNYGMSRDRSGILNDAMMKNIQNDLIRQRLDYQAEGEKYAAIGNQLNLVGQALSGIGKENFAMNMANSANPNYRIGPDGNVYFVSRLGGPLLKKIK